MERIFGRSWVFIGHDSQVPNPSDYLTTQIGRLPVVMTRHGDENVYVLHNRCSHRDAVLANEPRGNKRRFQCPYHGWNYDTDGSLMDAPLAEGFPAEFDLTDECLGWGVCRASSITVASSSPARAPGESISTPISGI